MFDGFFKNISLKNIFKRIVYYVNKIIIKISNNFSLIFFSRTISKTTFSKNSNFQQNYFPNE